MLTHNKTKNLTCKRNRFQDRLALDSDVTFLDTEHLGDLDEGKKKTAQNFT